MASLSNLKLLMLLTMVLIFGTLFALIAVASALFEAFVADYSLVPSLIFSLFLALVFIVVQWYASPWVVAWSARLKYVETGKSPWLESTVSRLARQAGVPVPKLAVSPDPSPNAFVFGRTRASSTLVVHRGLLDNLREDEVEAVIAHEIGHLRHNDCMVMTVVSAVPIIAYMVGRTFISVRFYGGGGGDRKGGAGGLVAAMLLTAFAAWAVYFVSQLLVMWLSRSREYYADAYSAYATKDPNALSSALSKIAYGLSLSRSEPSGLRAFYIGDPSTAKSEIGAIMEHKSEYDLDRDGTLDERELQLAMQKEARSGWSKLNELFSTHPTMYKRIILLKSIEREMKSSSVREEDAYRLV
jgi:heat shock protein HtpX